MELLRHKLSFMAFFITAFLIVSKTSVASSIYQTPNELKTMQNNFADSYEEEAKKSYPTAINLIIQCYHNTYECNMRLGWLYYLSKNYEKSASYYDKAIAIMPVATEPLWGKIMPLAAQEQWQKVDKIYIKILKIDPMNFWANYRLGVLYYYRKDYVSAKKYLAIALNLSPLEYNVLLMSAWNNYFLGQKKQAYALFNKVLLIKPDDDSAKEGIKLSR